MNKLLEKPKIRQSGIELLRIILILQVIFLHVKNFGEYESVSRSLGGGYELLFWVQQLICRCPVYVFMIISGYFSVRSRSTMQSVLPKAGKIYSSMIFYSLAITAILGLSGLVDVGLHGVVKSFFPFTSRTWYFISVYLIVLILSPAVNLALNKLSKKDFQILLLVSFLLFSVWQVASAMPPFNSIISVNSVIDTTKGRGLYGFLFMYIVGAYIRLHWEENAENKIGWKYLAGFFGCVLVDLALIYLVRDVDLLKGYLKIVCYNNAPIAVLQGIFMFLFFRTINFRSRIVNFLAAQTLGVYMIHEHWLSRTLIWDKLFSFTQNEEFYQKPYFLLIIYGIILAVFTVSTAIDLARGKLFDFAESKIRKK